MYEDLANSASLAHNSTEGQPSQPAARQAYRTRQEIANSELTGYTSL